MMKAAEQLTMTELAKMEASKQTESLGDFNVHVEEGQQYSCKKRCELGDGKREIFSIRFDPHDKHIAAACGDNTIRIYHIGSQKETYVLPNPTSETGQITSIRWRPHEAKGVSKNVLLSVNSAGQVQHWLSTSCKLLHTIEESTMLSCADFTTDGSMFATGGDDKIVIEY
jgi:WD40 repeat protein